MVLVLVGTYHSVEVELLQAAIDAMTALGSSMATLGGAAAIAKGGRDAVGDYASALSTKKLSETEEAP